MSTTSKQHTGIEEVSLAPRTIAGRRRRVAVSDLAAFFAEAIPAVASGSPNGISGRPR